MEVIKLIGKGSRLSLLLMEKVKEKIKPVLSTREFYRPFQNACNFAPNTKALPAGRQGLQDRKNYQVSPFNINDTISSALRDEKEGTDILMVKPAALYCDIIVRQKQQTLKPLATYHVSIEHATIETLAEKRLLNRNG